MEEEKVEALPVAPENIITHSVHSKRNLWIILGIVGVVLFSIGLVAVTSYQAEKSNPSLDEEALLTTIKESPPTPTPASPSADFVFYGDLSGEEKFAVASTFVDPILKASFAYPSGYLVQSFKADNDHKNAGIFFLHPKNSSQAADITYAVTCELENRKLAIGMCRESMLGDIEVSLRAYPKTETGFDEENIDDCRKEIVTNDRILFACELSMSPLATDKGMRYSLYLLGENPVLMQVSSRNAKEHAHMIRSIISSATNHL